MKILSITAQKPNSTGSGVYLTELVKEYAAWGYEQAVVAGVYEDDEVELPDGVGFYPVYFCEERNEAACEEKKSGMAEGEAGRKSGTVKDGAEKLWFAIAGMSDEMPYKSTRYGDMTPDMAKEFKKAFLKTVERAVKRLKPDVIYCHHLYLLTAAVREAFPEYTVYGFCHNTDLRQMQKTDLERAFIKEQIRKLDRIFVPQRAQEQGVREIYGVDPEKITRAGMGYNSKIFHITGEKKKDDVVRIVFAGKIAKKKGVISLFRALSLLDYDKGKLKIYLAGSTGNQEEYEEILRLARECPYEAVFLGRLLQPELSKVYNNCDIFVLPSFFEGIPLTVIEALACGDRVVMTDLPGIREWLLETAPGADVRYVSLPAMKNTDEPLEEELPEFEKRLAGALMESIAKGSGGTADVSGISWERIAKEVIKK